jgi:hypothetical protein
MDKFTRRSKDSGDSRFKREEIGTSNAARSCLRCQGKMIEMRPRIRQVHTVGSSNSPLELELPEAAPDIWSGRKPAVETMALVCTECGYVEAYAMHLKQLLDKQQ